MDTNQLLQTGWWPGKRHPLGKRLLQVGTLGAYNPDDRFSSDINKRLIAMDAQNAVAQRALEGQLRAAGDEEARRDNTAFQRKREQTRLTEAEAEADYMRRTAEMGIPPEEAKAQWAHIATLAHRGALAKGTATMLEDINRATRAGATAPLEGALAIKDAFAQGARADAGEATANMQARTAPGAADATNEQNAAIVRNERVRAQVEDPFEAVKRLQKELADANTRAEQARRIQTQTAPYEEQAAIDAARTRAAVEKATADTVNSAEDLGGNILGKQYGIPIPPGYQYLMPTTLKATGTNVLQAPFRPPAAPMGYTTQHNFNDMGQEISTTRTPMVPGMAPVAPNPYGGLIPIDPNILSNTLQRIRR